VYEYEGDLLFSVSIPIIVNGEYVGVMGTDFLIAELAQLVYGVTDKRHYCRFVTDIGRLVIHHESDRIGRIIADGSKPEILGKIAKGELFEEFVEYRGQDTYQIYVPVYLVNDYIKPWFIALNIPEYEIFATVRSTTYRLLAYSSLGVILISVIVWLLLMPVLQDITLLNKTIKKLALGQIPENINSKNNRDELGQIKSEMANLLHGLINTANFARSIGDGNLNAEYKLLSEEDALGNALLDMRNSLQNAENEQQLRAKEEEQRSWGSVGIAKFAEILRHNNNDMDALAYNVISNMVKYLDASQGGIYVLNDTEIADERVLELRACYAFNRKKYAKKSILPGEGLVGACFLEGQTIYMTDVPDDYINITSGLGEANPRAIIICPLKINDIIYGVIEIASFNLFEPYVRDFLEKVSTSIGATISTVRINIKTERLLEHTKIQTEEMANAEEELRQNMEEMQATQEEMRRREDELNGLLSAVREKEQETEEKAIWYEEMLDNCDPISVTDLKRNVTYMNKPCLNMLGVTLDQVKGRQCADVFKCEICHTENCGIECLQRGISKTTFNFGDKKILDFMSYLRNSKGERIGHIEVMTDVTDHTG
jgi:PAS domain-containing protein